MRSHILAAAIALTLLNAIKPLTVDDPSYVLHARHVAADPLDPYGGEMFMYQTYGPSIWNNAPPVPIYWLGLGVRLLGEHPGRLKLWLLPWALLLAIALAALFARFAPGAGAAPLWMILLSPAVLPGFNLMLDVPVMALILAALALFLRACDRSSLPTALAAGLVAGLAMQTKYTAVTAPVAILVWGLVSRRLGLAVAACAVSAVVFVGIEAAVHARYGDSPLLHFIGRRARGASGVARSRLVMPLFRHLGVLAAAWVPLGLMALGGSMRTVALGTAGVALACAAFALLPAGSVALLDRLSAGRVLNFENLTLGLMALAAVIVLARVVRSRWRARSPLDVLLLTWLAIELMAYFGVTTAPAARRVYGVLTVLALLLVRTVAMTIDRVPRRRGLMHGAAALGVAGGLLLWAVDFDDAQAQRDDVGRVLARIDAEPRQRPAPAGAADEPTIWCVGNHYGGFQFYAPRAGFRTAITGRSSLRAGDWLVVPQNVEEKHLRIDRGLIEPVARLEPELRLPVTTRYAYYGGTRPVRRPDPDWVAATLYRVTGDGIVVLEDRRPR